ncbi:MAG: hypothetical protein L3J52_10695, partial [Proteobacteria bacterium]|nr:hypothetical protein [Pseudomonadota bacterium]
MSYDFEIWSQQKLNIAEIDLGEGWVLFEDSLQYESKNWLIICDINVNCEQNDVPEHINPLITAISYLNSIYLQPLSAPKTALVKAKQLARLMSNHSIGAILDKQT